MDIKSHLQRLLSTTHLLSRQLQVKIGQNNPNHLLIHLLQPPSNPRQLHQFSHNLQEFLSRTRNKCVWQICARKTNLKSANSSKNSPARPSSAKKAKVDLKMKKAILKSVSSKCRIRRGNIRRNVTKFRKNFARAWLSSKMSKIPRIKLRVNGWNRPMSYSVFEMNWQAQERERRVRGSDVSGRKRNSVNALKAFHRSECSKRVNCSLNCAKKTHCLNRKEISY